MERTEKRWKRHLLVCVGMAAMATTALACWRILAASGGGVVVTLQNDGEETMHDVVVHVTGRSYAIGDLPVGGQAHVRVQPKSESHVEIEFTADDGARKRVNAGGYFEPGYAGTIVIRMNAKGVTEFQSNVTVSAY